VDSILKTGSAVCMVEFTDPFRVRPKLLSFNRAPNERRPGRTQCATADLLNGSVGDFLHTKRRCGSHMHGFDPENGVRGMYS
jgi:hypothetical protein